MKQLPITPALLLISEQFGRLSVATTSKAEDAPITIKDECKTAFSEQVTSF